VYFYIIIKPKTKQMKTSVKIERKSFDKELSNQIMLAANAAIDCETLEDVVTNLSEIDLYLLTYGTGGSHAWVSDLNGNRYLMITIA
jgi:hypothetical protein